MFSTKCELIACSLTIYRTIRAVSLVHSVEAPSLAADGLANYISSTCMNLSNLGYTSSLDAGDVVLPF